MTEKRSIRKAVPGIALAACFFIGTATGFLTNDLTAGILIGLGSGLIVMSVLRMVLKRRSTASKEIEE
ncbi:MAG: hypothetical protein IPO83_06265 [Chitinophagaceae bacterium]|nr:hypothetical protein [Chitinophagaceae bacterium]